MEGILSDTAFSNEKDHKICQGFSSGYNSVLWHCLMVPVGQDREISACLTPKSPPKLEGARWLWKSLCEHHDLTRKFL